MKVIIVAEHASTKFGGEAFLPLHYFRFLRARNIETWLVVHARTQAELELLFPQETGRIHFVPDTWLHRFLYKIGKLLPRRIAEATTGWLSHLYTQAIQRRIVRQLVCEHQVDIVHEPIPVSPRIPSLMYNVGAPVVIGPMNGNIEFPKAFRRRQSAFVECFVKASRNLTNLLNFIFPGKLKAKILLVANQRTKQVLPQGLDGEIIEIPENGVDLDVWQPSVQMSLKRSNEKIHFVYIGRLIDWKGLDLLLEAFQKIINQNNIFLEIIGDGAIRLKLEAQAVELGLTPRIKFSGWLSQQQCALKLEQSDCFVLPSLLECGGAVVLEAMAMGLPVIATNWGGPADYLDSSCGVLIEPTSREEFINNFAEAMLNLADSPELRLKMGLAGQERVKKYFDWDRKVDQILQIYQRLINTVPS